MSNKEIGIRLAAKLAEAKEAIRAQEEKEKAEGMGVGQQEEEAKGPKDEGAAAAAVAALDDDGLEYKEFPTTKQLAGCAWPQEGGSGSAGSQCLGYGASRD